jgi:hypothetical protein
VAHKPRKRIQAKRKPKRRNMGAERGKIGKKQEEMKKIAGWERRRWWLMALIKRSSATNS